MAKKKDKRVKTPAAVLVPQSREEVSAAIAKIGEAERERTRIEAEMNDELAVIIVPFETQLEEVQ